MRKSISFEQLEIVVKDYQLQFKCKEVERFVSSFSDGQTLLYVIFDNESEVKDSDYTKYKRYGVRLCHKGFFADVEGLDNQFAAKHLYAQPNEIHWHESSNISETGYVQPLTAMEAEETEAIHYNDKSVSYCLRGAFLQAPTLGFCSIENGIISPGFGESSALARCVYLCTHPDSPIKVKVKS